MTDDLLDIDPESDGVSVEDGAQMAIMKSLPSGFNLRALLTFLPDVRLKRQIEDLAREADHLEVSGAEGLRAADEVAARLRECIDGTRGRFTEVVSLANDLHKRLTGLRSDFIKSGETALRLLNQRIYAENRRLERIEEDARREAQAKADLEAREAAARAAKQAEAQHAPAPVVEALKVQAERASAPPVQTAKVAPRLANTATVARWKARLAGDENVAHPNPKMSELSLAQMASVKQLLRGILDGDVPALCIDLNWSYLNKRAASEKGTLAIPGIEAFDIGGTRKR